MSAATDTADQIIQAAIYNVAVPAAKAAAVAEAPWLGAPVLSQVFDYLLGKFADWIYKALDQAVVFSIIDLQTEAQRKAYDEAVAALKAVVNQPTATPQDIEKARQDLEKKLADLINLHP